MQGVVLPTGLVAFLFSDVEGSTRLWADDRQAMSRSLQLHDDIMRSSIEVHHGHVFTTAGDAFCVAFQRATDAVAAAREAQDQLKAAVWPGPRLRVRIGLHLGEAEERGGDYFGPVVNLAARVESAGHGGQILATEAVRSAAEIDATDLGEHQLKDIPSPVRLWQLDGGTHQALRTIATGNLPHAATPILGRADDIRAVRTLLHEHRLVTLHAGAGHGKTRLAIEVATLEQHEWRDGVWFCDLARVAAGDDVAAAVAHSIRLELSGSDARSEVANYVAGRQLLIVLDNCEHVTESAAALAESTFTAGGDSKIMATSREPLDVYGENTYQLGALPTDGGDSPAVRLFIERASAQSGFTPDAADLATVEEVCRRLDGTPLAIELAASRSSIMTPEMLLAALNDRFQLLAAGRRRGGQRVLEDTIRWSYELLDDDEQQLFRAMGVFVGPFDLSALAAVSRRTYVDVLEIADSLVAKSMAVAAGDGRLRLLETLKAFAEHCGDDPDEPDSFSAAHADHVVEELSFECWYESFDMLRDLRLAPVTANLVAVARWLAEQQRWTDLTHVLVGMTTAWTVAPETTDELIRRCSDADLSREDRERLWLADLWQAQVKSDYSTVLDRAELLRESENPAMRSIALYTSGALATFQHPARSIALMDAVLDIDRGRFGGRPEAFTSSGRAVAASATRDDVVARSHARDAVEGFMRGPERPYMWAEALLMIDIASWSLGEPSDLGGSVDTIKSTLGKGIARDPFMNGFLELHAAFAAAMRADTDDPVLRAYLASAEAGQVAGHQSNALIVLAEAERASGNDERARQLTLETGTMLGSTAGILAIIVAERLGVSAPFISATQQRTLDHEWAMARPMAALRAELSRRGWSAS